MTTKAKTDTLDLTAIEGRLAAATPGPWEWDGQINVEPLEVNALLGGDPQLRYLRPVVIFHDAHDPVTPGDAALIARAPTDIRLLLDAVKARNALATEASSLIEELRHGRDSARREAEGLRAHLERVTGTSPVDDFDPHTAPPVESGGGG